MKRAPGPKRDVKDAVSFLKILIGDARFRALDGRYRYVLLVGALEFGDANGELYPTKRTLGRPRRPGRGCRRQSSACGSARGSAHSARVHAGKRSQRVECLRVRSCPRGRGEEHERRQHTHVEWGLAMNPLTSKTSTSKKTSTS